MYAVQHTCLYGAGKYYVACAIYHRPAGCSPTSSSASGLTEVWGDHHYYHHNLFRRLYQTVHPNKIGSIQRVMFFFSCIRFCRRNRAESEWGRRRTVVCVCVRAYPRNRRFQPHFEGRLCELTAESFRDSWAGILIGWF